MKKVLVLAAAVALFATPALALTVVGSKHDLSVGGTAAISDDGYNEVCVFCHTPHGADTSTTVAPLWNRTVVNLSATTLYTSTTIEATTKAVTAADLQNTDAPLCLSCHDGSSITDALRNPANSAGNFQPTLTGALGGNANLGTNMADDHPIGMNYAAVQAEETPSGLNASPAGITFYNGIMWCSSCHDVHDGTNSPFLAKSNAASALCTTCHIK